MKLVFIIYGMIGTKQDFQFLEKLLEEMVKN